MASAEHLLNEAQYAFASISFGESRDNKRNRSRAESLCRKIIRQYPTTMEAGEAHAILRRLGEEAYTSKMRVRHRHSTQAQHHARPQTQSSRETRTFVTQHVPDDVSFNWGGLIGAIFQAPKFVIGFLAVGAIFLWEIVGPVILMPLALAIVMLGPGRSLLGRQQRDRVNSFIMAANAWIDEQGA